MDSERCSGDALEITVTFLKSRRVVPWDPKAESLLNLAERHGLAPVFCCRAGVCGTCAAGITRGRVVYSVPPVIEPEPGEILLCCSQPVESIEIDV